MDRGATIMEWKNRIDWKWTFVSAGLIATGFIIAFVLLAFTGQIQFGKDAPAWVQAVGSIAAILVAIAIPAWQRAEQRADSRYADDLRARSLASVIFRPVKDLQTEIQQSFRWLEDARQRDRKQATIYVAMPETLADRKDELHILGEPGSHLLRAMYYMSELADLGDGLWNYKQAHFDEYGVRLEQIQKEADLALKGLHRLMK